MAAGSVSGRQAPRPLPQEQRVCGIRPSARQDSAASPCRLRESGASRPGDRQKVNKHTRQKGSCQYIICPTSAFRNGLLVKLHRGEIADKSIIHSLESAVIEWSHQIRAVLKKDSSEALLEGKNPTPHTELLFWNNRSAPLLLQTPNVHRRLLRSARSSVVIVRKQHVLTGPQSWIVLEVFAGATNYSSFWTPVLSSEKCNLEPSALFLFLCCADAAELYLMRPISATFIICFSSAQMWQKHICSPYVSYLNICRHWGGFHSGCTSAW